MSKTLGELFPLEQARVRDLLVQYRELGAAGTFGATIIEDVLRRADEAAVRGDAVAMLRLMQEMVNCE